LGEARLRVVARVEEPIGLPAGSGPLSKRVFPVAKRPASHFEGSS